MTAEMTEDSILIYGHRSQDFKHDPYQKNKQDNERQFLERMAAERL